MDDNSTFRGIETWYEDGKVKERKLAEFIQESVCKATGGKSLGVKSDNALYVNVHTEAPSVLVETGFLSSDTERKLLLSEVYQGRIADGIKEGVQAYFQM